MAQNQVIIVGAGISGLVAALELEKKNINALVVEKSDRAGGRVKTDKIDGYLLDHGFQVLLTAYPEAKRYLDFPALELKNFDPGALIFDNGNKTRITDPIRKPFQILDTLLSPAGELTDKLKIWQLTQKLKKESIDSIFQKPDTTTLLYLENFGFSRLIIEKFFKPFFGGIFLENELNTSSRMFEFVFKMFSTGYAAIPSGGMEAIPQQLKQKLKSTEFLFNYEVSAINGNDVVLDDGNTLTAEAVIIATQPDKIIKNLQGQFAGYQQTTNSYFTTKQSFIGKPLIGLVPSKELTINNLCFLTDTAPSYSENGKPLLSVAVNHTPDIHFKEYEEKIKEELEYLTGVSKDDFKHIKTYFIEKALPIVNDVHYEMSYTETRILNNIFLAGDYLLNGSLNAAMTSGRNAAAAVVQYLH